MADPGGEHYGTASDFSNPLPPTFTKFTNFEVLVGNPPPPPPHPKQQQQHRQKTKPDSQRQAAWIEPLHAPSIQDFPLLWSNDPILNSRSGDEHDDRNMVIPAPPLSRTPRRNTNQSRIPFPLTPKNREKKTIPQVSSSSNKSVASRSSRVTRNSTTNSQVSSTASRASQASSRDANPSTGRSTRSRSRQERRSDVSTSTRQRSRSLLRSRSSTERSSSQQRRSSTKPRSLSRHRRERLEDESSTTSRSTSQQNQRKGFFRKLIFGKKSKASTASSIVEEEDDPTTPLRLSSNHKDYVQTTSSGTEKLYPMNHNNNTTKKMIDAVASEMEDQRALFFCTDEVSTLTNPTIEADPFAIVTEKSDRDDHPNNYWKNHSDGSIDPFQKPFFADPDGASPVVAKAKKSALFIQDSPRKPPSDPRRRRRQNIKDPSPRGDGSTVTTKAETNITMLSRTSPLRRRFQNATPRQREMQQEKESQRDPVGESPIHQKKLESRDDDDYPDPPLYLKHLDSSNSDTETTVRQRPPARKKIPATRISPRSKLNAKAAALLDQRSSSSLFNSYTNGKFRDRKLAGGGSIPLPPQQAKVVTIKPPNVVVEKPQSYSKALSVSTRRFKDRHFGTIVPPALPDVMDRNVEITTFVVAKGFDLFRYQREFDIEMGRAKRVVPVLQPKSVAKGYRITRPYQEPTDPLQKAGLRILAKAAIPIQKTFRRFLAQRQAVDRMWALIEIQSYVRRWRAEAALLASIVSAVTIQAIARGFAARTEYQRQLQAAIQMQRMIRGYLTAVATFDFVYRIVIVQACARGWVTRLRTNRQIAANKARMESECAKKIQTWWRCKSCFLLYQFLVVDTILAQAAARRYIAKRTVESMRDARAKAASIKIQATWRGYRQYALFTRHCAAIRIQKLWRGFVAFSYVHAMLFAIKIQTAWRRFRDESAFLYYMSTTRSATMIQATWRRYREESTYNAYMATVKVQSIWRCFMEKMKYRKYVASRTIQTAFRRFNAMKLYKRTTSAVKIQAAWRGFQGYTDFIFCLVDILVLQRTVRKWLATRKVGRIREAHWNVAATSIQSTWKMYICKNAFHRYKAATVIQKQWRCFNVSTNYIYLLADVLRIQCAIRCWFCKLELKGRRVFYAAQRIQARFRAFVALRCYMEYVSARLIQARFRCYVANKAYIQFVAARSIQARFRCHVANKIYTQFVAARSIQARFRCHVAYKVYTQFVAARAIQTRFRGHIANKIYKEFIAARLIQTRFRAMAAAKAYRRFLAARVIQKHWRGYSAYVDLIITIANAMIIQRSFRKYAIKKDEAMSNKAATAIQSIWRGHQTRSTLIEALILEMEKEEAATTIQTFWRSITARCHVVEAFTSLIILQGAIRRHQAICSVQMPRSLALAKLEIGAATTVQSCWRGIKSFSAFKSFVAARTIQAIWRGQYVHRCYNQYMAVTRIARNWRRFKVMKIMRLSRSATVIQANWRRFRVEDGYKQFVASRRISSIWRRHKAIVSLKRLKAVILIQSIWRRYCVQCCYVEYLAATRIALNWRRCKANEAYRQRIAAISIQSHWRGYQIASSFKVYMASRAIQTRWRSFTQQRRYIQFVSTRRIQTSFRRFIAEKKYKRTIASRRVQAVWRSFAARGIYKRIQAAIFIQAVWRGWQCWLVYGEFKAARYIQQAWRRKWAMLQLRDHVVARQIQTKWRSYWQQKHYLLLRRETVRLQAMARTIRYKREFGRHRWSCVLIQTVARRFLAVKTIANLQMPELFRAVKAQAMRERIASAKIQFWWRVVLDCQKEKNAALKIERFFLKIKHDVEEEIKRQANKPKRVKSDRRSRHSSKERSGRVQTWVDDVSAEPALSNRSESSSDIFSFSSGPSHTRLQAISKKPPNDLLTSPESRVSSEQSQVTPIYLAQSPERAAQRSHRSASLRQSIGRSSPSRNLIMRHEYDGIEDEMSPSIRESKSSNDNQSVHYRRSYSGHSRKPDPSPTKRPSSTRSSASIERARAIARSHRKEEQAAPKTVDEAYLNAASFKAKDKRSSVDQYMQKYGMKMSTSQDAMERYNKKKYGLPKIPQEPSASLPFDRCMADDLESLDDSTHANVDETFSSPRTKSRRSTTTTSRHHLVSASSPQARGIPPLSTRASPGSTSQRRHGQILVINPYPDLSVTKRRNHREEFITDESLEVGEEFGMI